MIVSAILLIISCGWVFNCIRRLPGDINGILNAYHSEDREYFWLEVGTIAIYWLIAAALVYFVLYPFFYTLVAPWFQVFQSA